MTENLPQQNCCENCESEFICGNIRSALAIVNSMDGKERLPADQRARLESIKTRLDRLGWSYPVSDKRCLIAGDQRALQTLANDCARLIKDDFHAQALMSEEASPATG